MRLLASSLAVSLGMFAVSLGGCTIVTDNDDGPTAIKTHAVRAAGDFKMSGGLGLEAGKLKVTVAAIRDPDAPSRPADPARVAFAISAAAKDMSCSVGKVSASSKAAVDLVFINDTTGSMSGTVEGINDSVQKFAEDVAAGGVDAKFSMYTYGDAFATKAAIDESFKIGQGDFTPPEELDADARPYIGLSDLAPFKDFLGELKASSVLGVGGGDSEENTIGALAYAARKLTFRDGAARMFVAIGDNASHQKGSGLDEAGDFAPPLGDEVVASLDGSAVVHVIGNDQGEAPYYNLKTLADQTGGGFVELPSDGVVDLGKLNLKEWLTSSFSGSCSDPTKGRYQIVLRATISGSKAHVGTLTFDVELS